jgi:hypothetical protein
MSAPPVVDYIKRSALDEIKSKSPFNIFNIAAVVAILIVGYFLYKKFTKKFEKSAIKLPSVTPLTRAQTIIAQSKQVVPDAPEAPEAPEVDTKEE